ncbi:unnamed protein product [Amoebophrya sp. A120]|nr:unnamed protein product [Amoebophrya sp. A120]|eukprot:GSA120T00023556001.1
MIGAATDDDYLSTGGAGSPSILLEKRAPVARPQNKKDDLYLEGYGRQWGEKITYSVGLCYGIGMLTGGFYGSLLGMRKGGATPKLFLNSVMNGVSSRGALVANQGAIMTLYYCVSNQLLGWIRGEDDQFNAPVAGLFSGALYKSTAGSWAQMGRYSLAGGLVFTGFDQLVRMGKI